MPDRTMPADNAAHNKTLLLSGLDPAAVAGLDGHNGLHWCAPAQLQDLVASVAPDAVRVVWLYRAPWASLHGCDDPPALRTRLQQWLSTNRGIFIQRRQLGQRLRLINLDGPAATALWRELGLAPPTPTPASLDPAVAARLFEWAGSQYWELFEALEAAAWLPSGEPTFRHGMPPPTDDAFHQALARLLADPSAIAQKQQQLQQECDVHLVQLQQTREELEAHYRRLLALESQATQQRESQQQASQQTIKLQQQLKQANQQLALEQSRGNAAEQEAQALRADNARLVQELAQQHQLLSDAQLDGGAHRRQLERMRNREQDRKQREASSRPLGRAASAMRSRLRRAVRHASADETSQAQLANILDSGWFDADWYLETYPDVRSANMDPAVHYLQHGWKEGRNPGPSFDTVHYLDTNVDVAGSGINPLWHFVMFGQQEGRRPSAG